MNNKITSLIFLLLVVLAAGCSTQAQAAAPADSSLLPKAVVDQFYTDYLAYTGDPATDEFKNPMVDRSYAGRVDLTAEMIDKLDKLMDSEEGLHFDPFLCAQDIPTSISASPAAIDAETALVTVTTNFENHSFTVELVNSNDEWLINDVLCIQ